VYIVDKDRFKEIAENQNFISDIYNYCDSWCDHCRFTSRCLSYSMAGEEFELLHEPLDINEIFWQNLSEMFEVTLGMVREMAEEMGVDLDSIDQDQGYPGKNSIGEEKVVYIVSHLARSYVDMAKKWFDSNAHLFTSGHRETRLKVVDPEIREDALSRDAFSKGADSKKETVEVIQWYQHQIFVKLKRALKGRYNKDMKYHDEFQGDPDGSAKVALIGIDRSTLAWGELRVYFSDRGKSIFNILTHLDNLKNKIEEEFPSVGSPQRLITE